MSSLREIAAGALRDRSGSVATIFAVALVPVLVAAGIGIDVARATSSRTSLQDAVDAAALAVAHLPQTTSQTDLQTKALAWLNANLNDPSLQNLTLVPTLSKGQIVLTASAAVPTTLTAIAGFRTLPISATSVVKWGVGHIEVALVLDNTGSMKGAKLTALIASAKKLVEILTAYNTTADPDAVKIAIVPFSNTVNIGTSYKNETWMDPKAEAYDGTSTDLFKTNPYKSAVVDRFTVMANMGQSWGGCVETRPQWIGNTLSDYDITDAVPSAGSPGTRIVPYFAPDEPDSGSGYSNDYLDDGTVTTGNNWDDRQGNTSKYFPVTTSWDEEGYNNCTGYGSNRRCTWVVTKAAGSLTTNPTLKETGLTSMGTGYSYGPNFGCGTKPIQRLTTDKTKLNGLINQMVAAGDTNVPMGLFWGWMALSPNVPFADGVAYGTPAITKIIIVLTDGANASQSNSNGNKSLYSGIGYWWQKLISTNAKSFTNMPTALDHREAKICDNIKAKKIVIYAVPVEVTDTDAKKLLQDCATDDEKYLDVDDADDLEDAFTAIAGSIGQMRISQ